MDQQSDRIERRLNIDFVMPAQTFPTSPPASNHDNGEAGNEVE